MILLARVMVLVMSVIAIPPPISPRKLGRGIVANPRVKRCLHEQKLNLLFGGPVADYYEGPVASLSDPEESFNRLNTRICH